MKYYKIGSNWWQSVNGRQTVDIFGQKPNAVIVEETDDPMGPRLGKEITKEEFNSVLQSKIKFYEDYFSTETSNQGV